MPHPWTCCSKRRRHRVGHVFFPNRIEATRNSLAVLEAAAVGHRMRLVFFRNSSEAHRERLAVSEAAGIVHCAVEHEGDVKINGVLANETTLPRRRKELRRSLIIGGRDPPPLHNVGLKNILVETLNNVGHPTRCPQPLNSVRLMVSYIIQCLMIFKPILCKGESRPPVMLTCFFLLIFAKTESFMAWGRFGHGVL